MLLCLLEIIMLVDCSCFLASKEMICAFCNDLKEHLNYVSDKNDLPFQVIPLNKILVWYKS